MDRRSFIRRSQSSQNIQLRVCLSWLVWTSPDSDKVYAMSYTTNAEQVSSGFYLLAMCCYSKSSDMHQYQYRQDNVEYVTENNPQMCIRYTCGAIFCHVPKTELTVTRYSTLCETGHKVKPLLKPLSPSSYIFIYLDNVTHFN